MTAVARNWRDVRAEALESGQITEDGIAAARRIHDNRQAKQPAIPNVQSPAGHTSPATNSVAMSTSRPSRGTKASRDQVTDDSQELTVSASNLPADPSVRDNQIITVGGDQPETKQPVRPIHAWSPAQDFPADQNPASVEAHTQRAVAGLVDPLLPLCADVLDDLERTRIANENRLRQMTRDEPDEDGQIRGFGMDESDPRVARLAGIVKGLGDLEHQAELELKRALRKHPLGEWVKQTQGVGEKQGARLLAAIGDPYWNDLHERPRTVSELWAFCGYHVLRIGDRTARDAQTRSVADSAQTPASQGEIGSQKMYAGGELPGGDTDQPLPDTQEDRVGVAASRVRGQKSNWSATAKMRTYLIAASCIKQADSPYRKIYDEGREKYADAVHATECKRCGPKGKPAQPGSALSAGHQHARAMRLMSKAILRDLWVEAKRIHESGD